MVNFTLVPILIVLGVIVTYLLFRNPSLFVPNKNTVPRISQIEMSSLPFTDTPPPNVTALPSQPVTMAQAAILPVPLSFLGSDV